MEGELLILGILALFGVVVAALQLGVRPKKDQIAKSFVLAVLVSFQSFLWILRGIWSLTSPHKNELAGLGEFGQAFVLASVATLAIFLITLLLAAIYGAPVSVLLAAVASFLTLLLCSLTHPEPLRGFSDVLNVMQYAPVRPSAVVFGLGLLIAWIFHLSRAR